MEVKAGSNRRHGCRRKIEGTNSEMAKASRKYGARFLVWVLGFQVSSSGGVWGRAPAGNDLTARRYASAVFAVALFVCLCVSVKSRCYAEMAKWIELIFGMDAYFHLSYTVL